jgi:hypothetical protein
MCALSLVAFLPACGGSSSKSADSARLIVIDQIPLDGGQLETTLPPGSTRSHEWRVLFSANPEPTTVLDAAEFNGLNANVRFIDRSLTRIPGHAFLGGYDASGRTPLEIDPNFDRDWANEIALDGENVLRFIYDTDGKLSTPEALPAEQYTITLNQLVTNKKGAPILEEYCGSFTSGPDNFPPVIMMTDPPNGAVDVDTRTPIVFQFNERVTPSSVIGNPPTTPPGISVTAAALGGPGGGGPNLVVTGTITQPTSNKCRFIFTPDSVLPGSSPGSTVVVKVCLNILVVPDPVNPSCPVVTNQIQDIAGNNMTISAAASFTMRQGPTISNNPVPPGALWFSSLSPPQVGMVGVNAIGGSASNATPLVDTNGDAFPGPEDDNTLVQTSINSEVGSPVDLVLGGPVTANNFLDFMSNAFPTNPPPALPLGSSQAIFYTRFCGLAGIIRLPNSSNSDMGTFVYVADRDNKLIRVLNSNTSLEMDTIPVPDPIDVSVSANLSTLFVSNFGTNSVSVIDLNNQAHVIVKEVNVNPTDSSKRIGRGPKKLVSQPDMEDVLVINSRDQSMSIMSYTQGFEVRKVIGSQIGPDAVDIGVTWRSAAYPLGTGTYFAYITNRGGNSISVFESGPSFPVIIGPDDVRFVLENDQVFTIRSPAACQTPLTGNIGTSLWYVNSEDGTVGHLQLATFGAPPNPYFPNPAPARTFGQITVTPGFGPGAIDIALGDNQVFCISTAIGVLANYKNNFGQLSTPIKGYVALSNQIAVFDTQTGLDLGIRIPVPGVQKLMPYWKQ